MCVPYFATITNSCYTALNEASEKISAITLFYPGVTKYSFKYRVIVYGFILATMMNVVLRSPFKTSSKGFWSLHSLILLHVTSTLFLAPILSYCWSPSGDQVLLFRGHSWFSLMCKLVGCCLESYNNLAEILIKMYCISSINLMPSCFADAVTLFLS